MDVNTFMIYLMQIKKRLMLSCNLKFSIASLEVSRGVPKKVGWGFGKDSGRVGVPISFWASFWRQFLTDDQL